MDVNDADEMDLALDPSLSLTAEGLWSDEESGSSPASDLDEPTTVVIKRKVFPTRCD